MTDRISDDWLEVMIEAAKEAVNRDPSNRKLRDHLWICYDLRDLRDSERRSEK